MSSAPRLRFAKEGTEVEGGLLWLDARRAKPFGVITHAHADHVARHERILCTPATAELVRRRSGAGPTFLERPYGARTPVGDLRVTLLPAGHILGSAMVLVEGRGGSLLFTGDVRLEGGLTTPPAKPVRADVLVTETTFGRPDHRFPDAGETRASLARFAREALQEGRTPVFLAYALGKAQEVMAALVAAGIAVAAHASVWNLCTVYRAHGITFPRSRRLGRGRGRVDEALVVPPHLLDAATRQRPGPFRIAAVTGWGRRFLGARVDAAFLLSDHSDFDGLLRLVAAVEPRKVYTLHGYAAEFARELRDRGVDAEPVPGQRGPDEEDRPGLFGSLDPD